MKLEKRIVIKNYMSGVLVGRCCDNCMTIKCNDKYRTPDGILWHDVNIVIDTKEEEKIINDFIKEFEKYIYIE